MSKVKATYSAVDFSEFIQLQRTNEDLLDFIKFMDERGVDTHKFYSEWQKITGKK